MAPSRASRALVSAGRLAGINVPLFSLRSESDGGIGDFDDLATLIEWAARSGQRLIALLPLGEAGPAETSPYNALSSFALDPIYLRPATLAELADRPPAPPRHASAADRVDHARVWAWKEPFFAEAHRRFRALPERHPRRRRFAAFRRAAAWLADYAIFRAVFEEAGGRSWKDWPADLRRRDRRALADARARLDERIAFFEFLQFAAEEAWLAVRGVAAERGVALMGDLPFAPSENSADVWSNPECFDLSRSVGAPPDAFSESGQRWGLPMYRWQAMRSDGWRWLRARARRMAELYDLLRVDHVVGLFRTFNFVGEEPNGFDPAEETDQIAQGREILRVLGDETRPAKLVAEDLGVIPAFVIETLVELDVPGYKVLRWQRDEDERFVDPAAYPECSLATTGTHDTDTLASWWHELPATDRQSLATAVGVPSLGGTRKLSRDGRHALLQRLYGSPSPYVVFPIQDLFGWRSRINTPATTSADNWVFRLPLPLEQFAADRDVASDTDALRASIDASGRLRKIA